ncbi:phosphinothricin N-acetyltransferase [Desulfocucumis palustris]|uniref:Phosphinothricin N-acetyltransferase n=1 Tax=Desulfocucumis palustris TaxID=1898651 RepID=A0A2L2X877_9FIRM|nr:arsinothricin resistance N-acetyltransferase ArsN1 family B [Desulfocucumis palustris]GBF32375.1 phosphinothricin N-acetyltransferase [Desulfocucumis palustris]
MLIRLAAINDAEQILGIYSPYVENTAISFEISSPSLEEMEKRIQRLSTNYPWIVFEDGNQILGYAYASAHHERAAYRWAVDVSIYVKQNSRGGGIGKALYSSLLSILRLQGYYNAYAIITMPNDASVGIHEYFGFRKAAQFSNVGYKFGKWHDVGWWELFLEQHDANPEEPLAISNIDQKRLFIATGDGSRVSH